MAEKLQWNLNTVFKSYKQPANLKISSNQPEIIISILKRSKGSLNIKYNINLNIVMIIKNVSQLNLMT